MILTIEHVSVRNNENQASQVFVLTYLDGFTDICRTRGFSWEFFCCKVVFGTFFLKGWSAKILGTEILTKQWRHAAFEAQRGGPEIVGNWPGTCGT